MSKHMFSNGWCMICGRPDGTRFSGSCTCRETCGDTDDELGVCKGLPRPKPPPLVELVMVRRDDPMFAVRETPDA